MKSVCEGSVCVCAMGARCEGHGLMVLVCLFISGCAWTAYLSADRSQTAQQFFFFRFLPAISYLTPRERAERGQHVPRGRRMCPSERLRPGHGPSRIQPARWVQAGSGGGWLAALEWNTVGHRRHNEKARRYPELSGENRRARLVVTCTDVGGRWSAEAASSPMEEVFVRPGSAGGTLQGFWPPPFRRRTTPRASFLSPPPSATPREEVSWKGGGRLRGLCLS